MASLGNNELEPAVSIRGSADLIRSYLNVAVHTVLFQRKVYPYEQFDIAYEFGIPVMISSDRIVKTCIDRMFKQTHVWLLKKHVKKVSLVISDIDSKKMIEMWQFNIEYTDDSQSAVGNQKTSEKSLEKIQNEIRAILRQINTTISVLPLNCEHSAFDLAIHLVHNAKTKGWARVPDLKFEAHDEMPFLDFSSPHHGVKTKVYYRTHI